jgi:putative membrane protein
MRPSVVAFAAALAAAGAFIGSASAQDASSSPSPAPSAPAPTTASAYLMQASSGDQFEIQSSQHAMQISQDPSIKSTAQMIIADHTRLSNELKVAATSAGMAPPRPELAPRHAQMLDRLKRTTAAGFDQAYRQAQIGAHQEALMLHRTYAERGDTPALKQAAAKAVPVIEMHLRHVQGLKPRGK